MCVCAPVSLCVYETFLGSFTRTEQVVSLNLAADTKKLFILHCSTCVYFVLLLLFFFIYSSLAH